MYYIFLLASLPPTEGELRAMDARAREGYRIDHILEIPRFFSGKLLVCMRRSLPGEGTGAAGESQRLARLDDDVKELRRTVGELGTTIERITALLPAVQQRAVKEGRSPEEQQEDEAFLDEQFQDRSDIRETALETFLEEKKRELPAKKARVLQRTMTSLSRAKVQTVGELLLLEDLEWVRGIGPQQVALIDSLLKEESIRRRSASS